jgi:outer membrane protein assembly factor BamB
VARTEPRRRVGSFTEPKSWPERLTRKWKVDVGLGYATPIVVGNRVFMFSRQGDDEVLAAFDAETGARIWTSRYARPSRSARRRRATRRDRNPRRPSPAARSSRSA